VGLLLFTGLILTFNARANGTALAEGNQAFRAGQYEIALSHYRAARVPRVPDGGRAANTDSTALLNFNMGIAYARLGRLDDAEDWLIAASAEPRLAPRAYYSLGQISQARAQPDEARVWFLQALAHNQASPKLRQLTRQALTTSGQRAPRRVPLQRPELSRAEQRMEHPFSFALTTRLAYDSNIYRSPASPYVDLAQQGQPLVTPIEQSGWFAPVHLASGIRWGQHDNSEFTLNYSLNGRFYRDSEFSNANELSQRLALTGTLDARRDPDVKRGTFLRGALVVIRRNAQGYNRDDGEDQFVNGVDVSDRFSYTRFGPELELHQDLGAFRVGLNGYAVLNRYDDTIRELDYSHEQYNLGTFLLYRPWTRTHVQLSYDATQRNYDYRNARDLNGDRFGNAPAQEFFYQEVALTIRQRLHHSFWFSIGYAYTDRDDQSLGYDDYQRHSVRTALYFDRQRFHSRLALAYRDYDFANAFAFDTPAGGEKTLTKTIATLSAEYRLDFNLTLNATASYDVTDSTDLRSEYERSQASLGVRWEW
jgi:hypothetical protein